jgi:endonuclease III
MDNIVSTLIQRGNDLFKKPYEKQKFTGNSDADNLLNDLRNYPHAFVLACIMDRQIRAEKAWMVPYEIKMEIGSFDFQRLSSLNLDKIKKIFITRKLHRFNETMANNFYLGIRMIHDVYEGEASNIWKDLPKSATVVRRFLQFKGIGVKIASMATNILARDFKIKMVDKLCIDISPDVQVKRVFTRLGLITMDGTNDELIYCARELNPEYPGIFDLSAWEIGRNWCRPKTPYCNDCYLAKWCPKLGIN